MRKRRVCDYTEEQEKWILENAQARVWKNQMEFTEVFNEKFGTSKTVQAINVWVSKRKIVVSTEKNSTVFYTAEMEQWLVNNFNEYDDYVTMTDDFNKIFNSDKTSWALRRKCVGSLGLLDSLDSTESVKRGSRTFTKGNGGMFKKGQVGKNGLPVGTVRINSDGRPFIKVMDCDGRAGAKVGEGHNLKEPFWKPLQKKIWEDHNGEVPKGYVVCSLNGNPFDTDIRNIGIIKKSLTPRMAKNGWWSEEKGITATGIVWCELSELIRNQKLLIKTEAE